METSGTFGNRNANASTGTNTIACRQGYDITAIDLTGKLKSEQVSAHIKLITTGDLYLPNALAIQIENGATHNMHTIKSVNKIVSTKGEILTYTTLVTNTGSLPLTDTTFIDNIPQNTTFVEKSVFVDGINYPNYNPQNGFQLGTLVPNQIVTVIFQVQIK